ncbi:MAG TPA: phosphatidylserine/phosphatidylglycerophosphate/cardiolipin synthase family protein [Candidatus Acidoferrum sp.]|nr:phosphatidylserine/phosphatidylglycerophosphate/cardiolipin synthase family protein [Candidatus Acidoferrum sp.]
MPTELNPAFQWLRAGDEIFPAMLAAIDAARQSVCLEVYTFEDSLLGQRFRDALIRARGRGVRVRVLVDAVGSITLSNRFWVPLQNAGGEMRVFNAIDLRRVAIRSHRKLLVCDEQVAVIGGFNISPAYEGDGIGRGWCDVAIKIMGPPAGELARSFDEMFERSALRHKRFTRWRQSGAKKAVALPAEQILFSGPGRGRNPFVKTLLEDLAPARDIRIAIAYFLPTRRLRRALLRVARRGGRVQLILAGKSDVPLAQLAAQSLYRRLLRGGVEIYEYQPQILHAKLVLVDEQIYAGSSNLDVRSLRLNYELMIRFTQTGVVAGARGIFDDLLKNCRRVTAADWRRSHSFWQRLKRRWAYFLLSRVDPYIARRQWRTLPK